MIPRITDFDLCIFQESIYLKWRCFKFWRYLQEFKSKLQGMYKAKIVQFLSFFFFMFYPYYLCQENEHATCFIIIREVVSRFRGNLFGNSELNIESCV